MKAHEIAEYLHGEFGGENDPDIVHVADIDRAAAGDIAFLEKSVGEPQTFASCLIVPRDFAGLITHIKVENPKLAFAQIAAVLHPPKSRSGQIHPSAVVASDAVIGNN